MGDFTVTDRQGRKKTHLKEQRESNPLVVLGVLYRDVDSTLRVVHSGKWHFGALLFRKRVCHRVR